ncbi:MAG: hypothetical protein AAF085_03335 [Planctomycetota bacterium]
MANQNTVPNNVYTILTLVALLALLAGVVYVVMRSNELFGTWNPLDAESLSVLVPVQMTGLFG